MRSSSGKKEIQNFILILRQTKPYLEGFVLLRATHRQRRSPQC